MKINEINISDHLSQQRYLNSFCYHDISRIAIFSFRSSSPQQLILEINDDYMGIVNNEFPLVSAHHMNLIPSKYFIIGRIYLNDEKISILNKKNLNVIEEIFIGKHNLIAVNHYDPCSIFLLDQSGQVVSSRTLFPKLRKKYCSFLFFDDPKKEPVHLAMQDLMHLTMQDLIHRMKHCYLRFLI